MGSMAMPVQSRVRRQWPSPGTVQGAWTAHDLETLPDDGLSYELIDGTLIVSPAPTRRHQRVSRRLVVLLADACPTGHEVLYAPLDWRLDEHTVVEPDVLVAPLGVDPDEPVHHPVVLVEIASPSSRVLDRTVKFERYARAGVPQYWIVDPGAEDAPPSIEVYDLDDGGYRLQVRATGDATATVTGPVPVTVSPAALIIPPV